MNRCFVLAAIPAALIFSAPVIADDGRFSRSQCDWAMATAPEQVPVHEANEASWNRATFVEYKKWCGQMADDARARLQSEFGVDARALTAQQSQETAE